MADGTRRLYVAGAQGAGGLEPDVLGRIVDPHINLDTPEGRYALPVAVLATFQHEIIIKDTAEQAANIVLGEVLPLLYSLLGLETGEEEPAIQLELPL